MKKFFIILPLIVVIIICIFLLIFLIQEKDPSKPPTALLNEEVPKMKMYDLFNETEFIQSTDFDNQDVLINFFASWCIPCKAEHPLFFLMKDKYPDLFIVGINMQDTKKDAFKFLNEDGNPYDFVVEDKFGYLGIEFGVLGLPETFLINKSGKIVYKYLGPLTKEIIENEIQPLL